MEKFFIVVQLARQVEGEYHSVNVLGAFHTEEAVKKFLEGKPIRFAQVVNGVNCLVDVGVIRDVNFVDQEEQPNVQS